MKYNDDNVYFAELMQSQLKPDGKGLGTFIQNGTITDEGDMAIPSTESVSEGCLLKYVDHAWCGSGSLHSNPHTIEHHVGELGCIARSFQTLRNICKQNH